MKKVLSDPNIALILTILLCIASVLLNTKIRLGRECNRISDYFYSGLNEEPAVASYLRELCNASEELMLLGAKSGIDNPVEAAKSIDMIRNALRMESRNLRELYDNYDSLLKETFRLESALSKADLSDADADVYSEAQHSAAVAKASIDASSYNNAVKSFQYRYNHFPTTLFAAISGISIPQMFA